MSDNPSDTGKRDAMHAAQGREEIGNICCKYLYFTRCLMNWENIKQNVLVNYKLLDAGGKQLDENEGSN